MNSLFNPMRVGMSTSTLAGIRESSARIVWTLRVEVWFLDVSITSGPNYLPVLNSFSNLSEVLGISWQDNSFSDYVGLPSSICRETFCLPLSHYYFMHSESISDRVRRLASGKCGPCKYTKPLTIGEARERLRDLPGWVLQSGSLQKEFRFKSYLDGLDFAYSLGKIAEMENHHPDLFIGWRRVKVGLSTHALKGLSKNDFIMAAKSELEYSETNRG